MLIDGAKLMEWAVKYAQAFERVEQLRSAVDDMRQQMTTLEGEYIEARSEMLRLRSEVLAQVEGHVEVDA